VFASSREERKIFLKNFYVNRKRETHAEKYEGAGGRLPSVVGSKEFAAA